MHSDPHPLRGQTFTLACEIDGDPEPVYTVEDWWDSLTGKSWMFSDGNPAAMKYAMRSALTAQLPLDDEVVYGKTADGLGHLVHVSELPSP